MVQKRFQNGTILHNFTFSKTRIIKKNNKRFKTAYFSKYYIFILRFFSNGSFDGMNKRKNKVKEKFETFY